MRPDCINIIIAKAIGQSNCIAVIVSGCDGDGAAALCGIKEVGGVAIAQKPETAEQPDMPESTIASGNIDFVLSPEEIAQKIVQIVREAASLVK